MLILENKQFKENRITLTPSQTRELIADLTRSLEEAFDHRMAFPCSIRNQTEEVVLFMVLPREPQNELHFEKN